jgi:hypothetical protein
MSVQNSTIGLGPAGDSFAIYDMDIYDTTQNIQIVSVISVATSTPEEYQRWLYAGQAQEAVLFAPAA